MCLRLEWEERTELEVDSTFWVSSSSSPAHFEGRVHQQRGQLGQGLLEHWLGVRVVNQQGEALEHRHPHRRPGHVECQVAWSRRGGGEAGRQREKHE